MCETDTITFLHIPGVVVNLDTEEHTKCVEDNKIYDTLKQNKIGSDSYTMRGSQTLNLTQKTKNEEFKGFVQEHKDCTASNWDIDDASKIQKMSEAK